MHPFKKPGQMIRQKARFDKAEQESRKQLMETSKE
jgi:hypothetical protein